VGAAWLLPSLLAYWPTKFDNVSTKADRFALSPSLQASSHVAIASVSGDNRSGTLRMAHTLADALFATAIVVVWQRLYGAQETGWMAAPLRVMGFVPAVVHMAWAQVLLAQPQHARTNPLWVGLAGFASVALLGAGCAVALEMGWLGDEWQGVWPYLLPMVVWQGSACVVAAYAHLPFLTHSARRYSWVCIGLAALQGTVLLVLTFFNFLLSPFLILTILSVCSCIGFLGISCWQRNLSKLIYT
jgi:hypothetical protein